MDMRAHSGVTDQQLSYGFNRGLVSVFPCFGTGNRRFQAFHTAFRRTLRRVPCTDIASIIAKPNPEVQTSSGVWAIRGITVEKILG